MKCERWNPIADLAAPLHWRKPRRVELHLDLFGEDRSDEWIAALHGVMAATPQHTYQVLTKRPERAARWYEWMQTRPYRQVTYCIDAAHVALGGDGARKPLDGKTPKGSPWPLRNVWLGASVEDQQRADERIPHLLRVPAEVRFLSVEPMIGRVDLSHVAIPGAIAADHGLSSAHINCLTDHDDEHYFNCHNKIHWVIVGGESGPGARPCSVEWIRSIVSQCVAADVPVFVKQLGSVAISDSDDDRRFAGDMTLPHPFRIHLSDRKGGDPSEWPEYLRVREWPATVQEEQPK